jgi:pSer/pThr/pTyr-binding forkhead associated (FHA) protein
MAAEKDDDTRIGSAPPPKVPPSTKARPEEEKDETRIGSAPPPSAKLRPPVIPAVPPTPKPPPAPMKDAAPSADLEDGEETVILVQRPQAVARLQRLQPAGRSDIIALDRSTYVLGRSHTCDIELFSATASRTHARLTNRDGKWFVAPIENRTLRIDGVAVTAETQLTHKVRLLLGADELLFLDDTRTTSIAEAPPPPNPRQWPNALLLAAIALIVAVAIWWVLRP